MPCGGLHMRGTASNERDTEQRRRGSCKYLTRPGNYAPCGQSQPLNICVRAADSIGMDGTTSSNVLTMDDNATGSCGCNALAMGVAILTDDRNRRVLTGVVLISEGVLSWHSSESKMCRSGKGS